MFFNKALNLGHNLTTKPKMFPNYTKRFSVLPKPALEAINWQTGRPEKMGMEIKTEQTAAWHD